jgi:3-oxoacyl-ACP reductase-like protein
VSILLEPNPGTAVCAVGESRQHPPGRVRGTDNNELEDNMTVTDSTILVTGANRGIGQALVEETLTRGAKQVFAASRKPLTHADRRVTQ